MVIIGKQLSIVCDCSNKVMGSCIHYDHIISLWLSYAIDARKHNYCSSLEHCLDINTVQWLVINTRIFDNTKLHVQTITLSEPV